MHKIFSLIFIFILAANAEANGIANLKDFGAKPNDDISDSHALRTAIKECVEKNIKTLLIPTGTYLIDSGFIIENADTFTIDAQGSTFMIKGIFELFKLSNSKNIALKNFVIDTLEPPYAYGEVLNSGEKWFTMRVESPYKIREGVPIKSVLAYDPVKNCIAKGCDIYQLGSKGKTQKISENVMRVETDFQAPQKGTYVIARYEVYGPSCVGALYSENVILENFTIHSYPGMGTYMAFTKNITLDGWKLLPKSAEYKMSTTADGSHFNQCYGEILIKNSIFQGMGDDATNIHQMYSVFLKKLDKNIYQCRPGRMEAAWLEYSASEGETIAFGSASNFLRIDKNLTAKVLKKEIDKANLTITYTLDKDFKPKENTTVCNLSSMPKVEIIGTKVSSNRARGFLIKTQNVLIENCTFENIASAGILLDSDNNYWYEGVPAKDVLIKNCIFINCNIWGAPNNKESIICLADYAKDLPSDSDKIFKNIKETGNKFKDCKQGIKFIDNRK